ncbi:MAG: 50S ribosomal protein L25, partial [Bacteroidota bacterium]
MNTVAVNGTLRTETGKKATKVIRRSGQVPGVIYGGEENVHFSAETLDFRDLVYTPNFNLADITIDGKVYQCILKSASFHPVTDDLEHLDFLL